VLFTIIFFLDIHYWYTRRSTFAISILGTVLISGSELFAELPSIIPKGKEPSAFIASLLSAVLVLALPFLVFKTILRIKFGGWWKEMGWFPTVHRAGATRREITSARLEAATNWRHKAAVCYFDHCFINKYFYVCSSALAFPRVHILCPRTRELLRHSISITCTGPCQRLVVWFLPPSSERLPCHRQNATTSS
jgi:hypothetical protein